MYPYLFLFCLLYLSKNNFTKIPITSFMSISNFFPPSVPLKCQVKHLKINIYSTCCCQVITSSLFLLLSDQTSRFNRLHTKPLHDCSPKHISDHILLFFFSSHLLYKRIFIFNIFCLFPKQNEGDSTYCFSPQLF